MNIWGIVLLDVEYSEYYILVLLQIIEKIRTHVLQMSTIVIKFEIQTQVS
jgi:hypothetical protein